VSVTPSPTPCVGRLAMGANPSTGRTDEAGRDGANSRTCLPRFHRPARTSSGVGTSPKFPTDEGKLYLATVLDLFRGSCCLPTSTHPDAELACDAIRSPPRYAAAAPRSRARHFTPTRSTLHRNTFQGPLWACRRAPVDGRVGSTMPPRRRSSPRWNHEVLSRHHFTTRDQARKFIVAWCQDFYNTRRSTVPLGCTATRPLPKRPRRTVGRGMTPLKHCLNEILHRA